MIAPVAEDSGYELIDAGDGRRLERFGDRMVDRPAAGALAPRVDPERWSEADLRFDRDGGWHGTTIEPWTIDLHGLQLERRPTEAGQVGVFPEHAALWGGLEEQVGDGDAVLHLFAHTGATTLALARAGARVAHVDAGRPAIAWARRNAELSGLAGAPIRWLVDDAETFVAREVRRGRQYDGVVLDPPAYGHGASGRGWRLDDRLDPLLAAAARLEPRFVLLTAHSVGWDADRLGDALRWAFPRGREHGGELSLAASSGATLALGAFAAVIIDR